MKDIIECTKELPWNGVSTSDQSIRHHDTHEVGQQDDGWPGGDIVTIECKNCGTRWTQELPQ